MRICILAFGNRRPAFRASFAGRRKAPPAFLRLFVLYRQVLKGGKLTSLCFMPYTKIYRRAACRCEFTAWKKPSGSVEGCWRPEGLKPWNWAEKRGNVDGCICVYGALVCLRASDDISIWKRKFHFLLARCLLFLSRGLVAGGYSSAGESV